MILYLDSSALVKRHVAEKDSDEVINWIDSAEMAVTGLITRVEVAAAIGRARRMQLIDPEEAQAALRQFRSEWEDIHRLPINENTVIRGDALAFEHDLRGYDATHLACALIWQETLDLPVTLASYDGRLRAVAWDMRMDILPRMI